MSLSENAGEAGRSISGPVGTRFGELTLVKEPPPGEIWGRICAAFPVKGKPVMFCFGDIVYAPTGVHQIAPQIIAHELVHGRRQREVVGGIDRWWNAYIDDRRFRLEEEKLAHLEEARKLLKIMGGNRNARRSVIPRVAERLCQPIYQFDLTKKQAMEWLDANV